MKMLSILFGLLEQFQPDGPLPCDDLGVVVGRHIDETAGRCLLLRVKLRQSALRAMQNDVHIEGADPFELGLRYGFGQHDGECLTNRCSGLRRGNAMVAG